MKTSEVIDLLKGMANPAYHKGMARFGIDSSKALGVKVPELRLLAKTIKKINNYHLIYGIPAYMNAGFWRR